MLLPSSPFAAKSKYTKKTLRKLNVFLNAGDRNRTGTVFPQQDFKSCASASSATPAFMKFCSLNDQKTMGRGGFEPPKQVAADLQSVPFGHSGICPFSGIDS